MMMKKKNLLLATVFCLSAQTALASDPRLSDATGRWVCQPDQAAWPQVLIDFEDDAYRRCDQNTCVTYALGNPAHKDGMVHIQFAPNGGFDTSDAGGRYIERIDQSGKISETTGTFAFRGLADIYNPRS
jgi:hypothetical protein